MNPTRKTDESFYRLFSASHTVSEHLTKREDSELRDKYDHNAFCYYSQPSADEVRAALAYQKERGDTFLKLEGYEPLADAFGMECEETLTMIPSPRKQTSAAGKRTRTSRSRPRTQTSWNSTN